jgi:HKD family nuclease
LLTTRRHVPTWFEATPDEQIGVMRALAQARTTIEARYRPDGFNIGVNVGIAGGQTVLHLHVHLIPRYAGDVADPRGGVRHVIPAKANYLAPPPAETLTPPRLVTGGDEDPLFPYLVEQLARADRADIAVGFILPSGVLRLEEHFRDLLRRGGHLRVLTGDYLGVTDPDALMRLMDLEGSRELRVFETIPAAVPAWPAPLPAISFHPKAYLFRRHDGDGVAFIGSSNLTETALTTGIEWSYRVVSAQDKTPFGDMVAGFRKALRPSSHARTDGGVDRCVSGKTSRNRRAVALSDG